MFWLVLACFPVGAGIQSYRELRRKYNLWIQECRGLGWGYAYDGGNNPNGIVAVMSLKILNKGSEHCQIKAELAIAYSGSTAISRVLPTIELEGYDPNKDSKNKYTAELATFAFPHVNHQSLPEGALQATILLHCWNDRKWVFGRKTKCRHIELPHDEQLRITLAFRR
jgi:hypothetical protein